MDVPGVQEIADMMKLEGSEASILAEAFKTNPKLHLPNGRSTQMLCISYRVLLNILNILATEPPFTITEDDKKSLFENLKDASITMSRTQQIQRQKWMKYSSSSHYLNQSSVWGKLKVQKENRGKGKYREKEATARRSTITNSTS